jgi:large subunit ribosomal protein L15
MVANKRKKNSRLRGSHTHGYGSKKKHRGAGSRGGRGMAGTGKRADTKKPTIAANTKYFGVHGFTSVRKVEQTTLNLNTLVTRLSTLGEQQGKAYVVDLSKSKYTKLLGSGSIDVAVTVTVGSASARAVEKVEAAGGTVVVLNAVEAESADE